MRNFLIIVVGILILNAAILFSGGFEYIKKQFEPAPSVPQVQPDVTDTFRKTLELKVQQEIGQPIEGYEPAMFLQVFPGLVESDFNGVEASIGKYVLVDGKLTHQLDKTQLIHSAAGAITRKGMETLYKNIAARTGIDIYSGGTLTQIMDVITKDSN